MATYQKIHISTVLKHYKRPEIQQALVDEAGFREIAISYGGTGYGKRPDVLNYPKDVMEMVKLGATSFHCSEELWTNPLQVTTGMKPEELNKLRRGWDLILDIDCPELEYSKIAADLLVSALKHFGIKQIGIKFSGNHGFHIAVPFESFPQSVNGIQTKDLFPDGPRKIAAYLGEMIKEHLAKKLLEKNTLQTIANSVGKTPAELTTKGQFDPFKALSIDTVLISSRHLFRMPYSLNEKSGLVSCVITPQEILLFQKTNATPDKITTTKQFIIRDTTRTGEANELFKRAFDEKSMQIQEQEKNQTLEQKTKYSQNQKKEFDPITVAIPEEYFPPCIKKILEGLQDGKKRAAFILINFLSSCGWDYDKIEQRLIEWNKKNPEPLRDVLLLGQLKHHKIAKKKALPPNCTNKAYMVSLGVCQPDSLCGANAPPTSEQFAPRIKNPAGYAIVRQKRVARENEEKKTKKTSKKDENTPPKPQNP